MYQVENRPWIGERTVDARRHVDTTHPTAEIEAALLDEKVSLASALRKCVALGGELRSVPLRDWATRELRGYEDGDDLPANRVIDAAIRMDYLRGTWKATGMRLSHTQLPEFARDAISESVRFYQGVGFLENLEKQAAADPSRSVHMSLPTGAELATIMSRNDGPYTQIMALYWDVGASSLAGVLDSIRTVAVGIVSELRASSPASGDLPPQVADQAVNVVLNGGKRNIVMVAPASGGSITTMESPTAPSAESGWTKIQTIWTVVGVIVVAVIAVATYLGAG